MSDHTLNQEILDLEPDGQLALSVPEAVEANIKDYYWVNQSREIFNTQLDLDLMDPKSNDLGEDFHL